MSLIVGILNIPTRGSVPLVYLGNEMFSAGTNPETMISLDKIKLVDSRGLIAWYNPDFLTTLINTQELSGGNNTEQEHSDNPLGEIDLDTMNRGPVPKSSESLTPMKEDPSTEKGITSANIGGIRKTLNMLHNKLFPNGVEAAGFGPALRGIFIFFFFVFLIGFLFFSIKNIASDIPFVGDEITVLGLLINAEPVDEKQNTELKSLITNIQKAITSKNQDQYNNLVDIEAVAQTLSVYYVETLANNKHKGTRDEEIKKTYQKILTAQEKKSVSNGTLATSIFTGEISNTFKKDDTFLIVIKGGGINRARVFEAKKSNSGWRITDINNPTQVVQPN